MVQTVARNYGAACQLYRDTVSTNFHSISLTNGLLGILLLVKGHESKTGRITSNPDVTDITELNKAVSEVLLLQTSSVANIDPIGYLETIHPTWFHSFSDLERL
jgi:hypothetical protein